MATFQMGTEKAVGLGDGVEGGLGKVALGDRAVSCLGWSTRG